MSGIAMAVAVIDIVVLPFSGAIAAWSWERGYRSLAAANAVASSLLAVSTIARVVTA